MAGMTLDELNQRVSVKYAPYDIDLGEAGTLHLVQSLLIPDNDQVELTRIQREFNAMQEERHDENGDVIEPTDEEALEMKPKMVEKLSEMIRLVAEDKEKAEIFLKSIDYSLPHLMVTFEAYAESSQMGEASASPSS